MGARGRKVGKKMKAVWLVGLGIFLLLLLLLLLDE